MNELNINYEKQQRKQTATRLIREFGGRDHRTLHSYLGFCRDADDMRSSLRSLLNNHPELFQGKRK